MSCDSPFATCGGTRWSRAGNRATLLNTSLPHASPADEAMAATEAIECRGTLTDADEARKGLIDALVAYLGE